MIGGWLNDDTSVAEVAAFADKVYVKKDLSGFTGDPRFIQSSDTQKMFSKLRSSIAGLYAWRVDHAAGGADKENMDYARRILPFARRGRCARIRRNPFTDT